MEVKITFAPETVDVDITGIDEPVAVTVAPLKAHGVVQGVDVHVLVSPEAG